MVEAAELAPGETVLEIGTGLGYLTDELLKTSAKVVSLEYDKGVFERARLKYATAPTDRLQLLQGDIRQFDWQTLGPAFKVCANIPYYLSANLLRKLTELTEKPILSALLLPQAVALKLAEKTKRSLLAVLAQSHYEVGLGQVIAKEMFSPPPKIDSQIAVLKRQPAFDDLNADGWQRLVGLLKVSFAAPRKQLIVNLSRGLQRPKLELEPCLKTSGIGLRQRAEELSNEQWQALLRAVDGSSD